ncbi:MAG: hypothetical protein B6D77_05065 [gamma proteobacterium symbiont of Ctena orbiculata]|nr:MAG: hypothetical protein B6D77_05065 [gamma proteobacterium symbiont of Ctena orbiculata]PVV21301.1 MAG: hypothetical protein B6D78_08085 [gamma proteobacterium symbiont of Ctena orbiculata]PVV27018.1 MAG: hypothetical protein B6D79_04400 [gamma proteobacterium symbiont of Ctena orbiculata]
MKFRSLAGIKMALATVAMIATPPWVYAETFTGTVNGHDSAHNGVTCPVEKLDPHVALESYFVLMVGEGDYLFMPNLSRDIKVRYVLDNVQVKGEKHPRFNAIQVDEFRVKKGGKFVTVWSRKQAAFEYEALYRDGLAFPGQKAY